MGQRGKAESSYQAAQRQHRKLAAQQPDEEKHRIGIAQTQTNLASMFADQNRLDEAERLVRDARAQYIAVGRELRFLGYLKAGGLLAQVLRKQKKFDEARKVAQRALGRCEAGLISSPDSQDHRELQVHLLGELAAILIAQEQYAEAEPHLRSQLHVLNYLMAAQRDPATFLSDVFFSKDPFLTDKEEPRRWHQWMEISLRLARVLRETGQHRQAEMVLGPAILAGNHLAIVYAEVLKYRVATANVYAEAALLLADRWPEESRSHPIQAVRVWRKAAKDFKHAAHYKSGLHGTQPDAAWFATMFAEFDFTDPAKRQAIDKAIADAPPRKLFPWTRAVALQALRYERWESSVRRFERIVKHRDGSDAFDRFHLAIGLAKSGKTDEARRWFNRGVEWMEQNKGSEDEELVRLQNEAKKVIGELKTEN